MDKREALEIYLKGHRECLLHKDCFGCPFWEHYDGRKICVLVCMGNRAIAMELEKKLKRISEAPEQKPLAPSENIFGDFASGPSTIKEHVPLPEKDGPIVVATSDNVNHPKHYLKCGLECIQVIEAQLTPQQYEGYLYGNVLKYMWRWLDKNGLEDLRKAAHYLMWLQEEVKKNG